MTSSGGSTQFELSMLRGTDSAEWARVQPVLQIAWSVSEPERIGEIFVPPAGGDPAPAALICRGGDLPDDVAVRLVPIRQRPGRNTPMGPLPTPTLSRSQLLVRTTPDGLLEIENLGRPPLTIRGEEVRQTRADVGDVLTIGTSMVLQVLLRPERMYALRSWPDELSPPFGEPDRFGIVGESSRNWSLREDLAFAAARDGHVLLTGESGTGKELGARVIHGLSPRGKRPLITRNAATLPSGLIDAELFGNAKSYPNPGMPARSGLIGEATGSTLFLDEVGELDHDLQAHLLRVLDSDGEYQRLGESQVRRSDLRLIAATNRDPKELKHDLAARLVHRVRVPTLAERRADLPLLMRHLLYQAAASDPAIGSRFFDTHEHTGRMRPRIDVKLVDALLRHRYSTHVRELSRLLWLTMSGSRGHTLRIVPEVEEILDLPGHEETGTAPTELSAELIVETLERCEGVQARAWKELGLRNRFQLRRLMKKYGIDGPPSDATDEETQ